MVLGFFGSDPNDDSDPPESEEPPPSDDNNLTKRDVRKEMYKSQQEFNRIQQKIEKRRKRYQKLLRKGAEASTYERRIIAQRARLEKFKAEMLGLQRLRAMRNLTKYTVLESKLEAQQFMSEFMSEGDQVSVGDIDIDFGDVGDIVAEAKAEIKTDMQEVKQAMDTMEHVDPTVNVDDLSMTEIEQMDRIQEGKTDPEEISMNIDMSDRVDDDLDDSIGLDSKMDDLLSDDSDFLNDNDI